MHAFVLAGGAARGAYGAGVMRYIFTELPKNLGWTPWPDLVSGTSVGALNGVFAACHNEEAIHYISDLWRNLSIEHVYRLRAFRAMGSLVWALRSTEPFFMLDARPLRHLVDNAFPNLAFRTSIDSGLCKAFYISATDLASGFNTLFVDTKDNGRLNVGGPNIHVASVKVKTGHCLASAALPLLFQPVEVDGRLYVDGGLRQNTPIRPVIRSGARHILVVSGRRAPNTQAPPTERQAVPNLMYLAGKSLNALLLDPVERDLVHVEQFNQLLALGVNSAGAPFLEAAEKTAGIHPVNTLFLRPRDDLGSLARQIFEANPPKVPAMLRRLLSMAANPGASSEADLLSYLYFDRAYTAELETRGFDDARANQEALATFFEAARQNPQGLTPRE